MYEYNNKGLPVKVVFYNSDIYYKTDRYEYDSDDRLIRVTDSSWQMDFIYEYSYDGLGNPAILNASNLSDKSQTRNEWTSYDPVRQPHTNFNISIMSRDYPSRYYRAPGL